MQATASAETGTRTAPLLFATDVAEMIGMRVDYVYRLCREDAIPHLRLGRSYRFIGAEIENWLKEKQRGDGR